MNHKSSNPNVPASALVFGERSYCSGEIRYSYYLQFYAPAHPAHPVYGGWALWRVCDWVGSIPEAINLLKIREAGLEPAYVALFNDRESFVSVGHQSGHVIAWGIESGFSRVGAHPITPCDKSIALLNPMPHVLIRFNDGSEVWYPYEILHSEQF